MSFSAETYALSKKFTNQSISGISGALAGKNCTIQSITEIEGGHRVTFQWTADNGTVRTQTMDVMDGSGAEAIEQIYADNGVTGAKNLLPYPYVDSTKTVDSVTFTDNGDGSVSLSGTASANPEFRITPDITDNRYKGMILTSQGGSSTASGAYVRVRVGDISSGSFIREVVGSEIIIPEMASNEKYYIAIRVTQGTNTSGIRIYPMLRLASDTDSTYVPYAMTNKELTDSKFDRAEQAVLGAKNLIPFPYVSSNGTIQTVTYTVNEDGSVLVYSEGAHTSNSSFQLWSGTGAQFKKAFGNSMLILSGCPSGGAKIGDNAYSILLVESSWSGMYRYDIGDGLEFSPSILDDAKSYYIVISILASSQSGINKTFYPMLRLASDPDDTYQPYAMTNRELTEELTVKQSGISTSLSATLNVLRKYGKVVTLSFRSTNTTGSAGDEIGIIPDGFRPANDCIILAGITDGASKRVTIAPDSGRVAFADAVTNATLTIHTTWITS